MTAHRVPLFLFAWIACAFSGAQDRYYQISARDNPVGFIQESRDLGENARIRKTFSCFSFEKEPESDQRIFEKTVYREPHEVLFYSLEYLRGNAWEEYRYWFRDGEVVVSIERDGRKAEELHLPVRPNVHVLTDYFSLVPLLVGSAGRPRGLFVLDPKQIIFGKADPQRLTILPLGPRNLEVNGQTQLAEHYRVKWLDNDLLFWISREKELLQIQNQGTVIRLTPRHRLQKFVGVSVRPDSRRPLPFSLRKNHRYVFYCKGEKVGHLDFQIQKIEQPQGGYRVLANGSLRTGRNTCIFHSKIVYAGNWCPLSYQHRETSSGEREERVEIDCEFVMNGIKASFRRNDDNMERFLPVSEDFALLDNNGIHHFAILALRLPPQEKGQSNLSIFHPRRMQFSPATVAVTPGPEGARVELASAYHSLRLSLDREGRLVRYEQGDLDVRLE